MSTLVKFSLTEDDLAKSDYIKTSDIDRFLNMGTALGLSEWRWFTPEQYSLHRMGPCRVVEIRFYSDDWGQLFLGLMRGHFPNVFPEIDIPSYGEAYMEAIVGIWESPPEEIRGFHKLREIRLI